MEARGNRQTLQGVVISDKMDKTIVVETKRLVKHKQFHKYIRRNTRYKAHDEENACRVGDRVRIIEARPISKDKRWRVREIVEKAK